MQGVFNFFTALLAKIANFAKWLLAVFKQVFVDIWNILTDNVCWIFDQSLDVAVAALSVISAPFNPQTYYALIPADVANILGYIGIPQCLSIIVASLVVRFTLQTIPFVRWGS
ncbi:DUF2523 family protein [Pseudomonas sp. zfem003]|uniref:DUF2523 family protein n=1 Tax=Pseudomonas sp. zfem003 TaxID=3078198 RepID=UPI002927FBE1|nr:DUF2523 family protein [Pseudomonas sp. zfem003]MDU9400808.1 DUF2523 family protein [Pseudomonas sp. zfem003]